MSGFNATPVSAHLNCCSVSSLAISFRLALRLSPLCLARWSNPLATLSIFCTQASGNSARHSRFDWYSSRHCEHSFASLPFALGRDPHRTQGLRVSGFAAHSMHHARFRRAGLRRHLAHCLSSMSANSNLLTISARLNCCPPRSLAPPPPCRRWPLSPRPRPSRSRPRWRCRLASASRTAWAARRGGPAPRA